MLGIQDMVQIVLMSLYTTNGVDSQNKKAQI